MQVPFGRIYAGANNDVHQRPPRFYLKAAQVNPIYDVKNNYDLRLIVLRHAERLDQSAGTNWYEKIFSGAPSAPREAYRHPLLPHRLPHRSNTLMYEFDPPISRKGEHESLVRGSTAAKVGTKVDYCYSSPASRCVLTSSAVLKGMNHSHVPIRIEPLLFEPMNWNQPLRLLGRMDPFLAPNDWKHAGHHVDRRYRPTVARLPPYGTEFDYYDRSKAFFDNLVKRYGGPEARAATPKSAKRRVTVLVVGHASTTEILAMIALNQKFDVVPFTDKANKIPYLHAVVIERDATTGCWSVPLMINNN